jgi:hypothetical protein
MLSYEHALSLSTMMKLSLQVDIVITTRDGFWILADVVIVDPACTDMQR